MPVQSGPVKKLTIDIEDTTVPSGPSGQVSVRILRPQGARTALGSAVGAVYGSRDRRVLHYWTGCRTRSRTSSPTSAAWYSCGHPNSTSWGWSRRCASTPTGSPESDLPDQYIWTGSL
jgi:hypothetical protein